MLFGSYNNYTNPFFLCKVGLERYEGENLLWNSEEELNISHIFVRIDEEMKKLEEKGFDFYLFGTNTNHTRNAFKSIPDQKPIKIFFVVRNEEYKDWKKLKDYPSSDNLDMNKEIPERYKRMQKTRSVTKIPFPLRLWEDPEKDYKGLVIRNLSLYKYNDEREIKLENCVYFNSNIPYDGSQKSATVFLLKQVQEDVTDYVYHRHIIAEAELIFPYISRVYPE